ncbi:MAG: class C sortase [Firmicutes bacterium]|nr:class C sortase [Bacillota bacterium]
MRRRKTDLSHGKANRPMMIMILALYVAGAAFIFYPTVSNLINRERNLKVAVAYEDAISDAGKDEADSMYLEALAYNSTHKRNYVKDAFSDNCHDGLSDSYSSLLDPQGTGVMGYLDVPKINETLAIYHGTGEEVLEKGVGHIEGTSLPVGGLGSHSVLCAHRGLPSARLFTDLDQLEEGDRFYIHVVDRILTYEVDQITVVEPDEIEALKIEPDKDYVTLLTCTPYGINTKRLLVRGKRVPNEVQRTDPVETAKHGLPLYLTMLIISLSAVVLITISITSKKDRRVNDVWRNQ